ncbi:MAG: GNAT family N-acetyltransferase [Acidobacteria bacterium]|nr:GNAT family N-acetyltransferase [Acidobacteriota bacterium]
MSLPETAVLRPMLESDVDAGLRLCRQSGWNQVASDWRQFLTLTPDGATVAVAGGGVVIGTVATMRYAAMDAAATPDAGRGGVAWLAMVLVDADRRGGGIGTRLLRHAIATAHLEDTLGLDATPLGQPIYEKLGFVAAGTLVRMQRQPLTDGGQGVHDRSLHPNVRPATPADIDAIARLDAHTTGLDRAAMLAWLRDGAPTTAWVCESAGHMTGVVLGRIGHDAVHIGPIIAPEVDTSAALLDAAITSHPDARLYIDIDDASPGWRSLVEACGFIAQRPFTRMYRGPWRPPAPRPLPASPSVLHPLMFAIIGPEFG